MKILVLEDDVRLAGLIARGLRREGHAVDTAATVEDARWHAGESVYDVLVLDVMLPDGDGFELCGSLRATGNWTPVLLLTARDAVTDRVRGLDVGADTTSSSRSPSPSSSRAFGPHASRGDGAADRPDVG